MTIEGLYNACDEVRAKGVNVVREAGPMKHGTTVLAFVEDPDGYKIELLQKEEKHAIEPTRKISIFPGP